MSWAGLQHWAAGQWNNTKVPLALLYHYPTFGGKANFARLCAAGRSGVPALPWENFMPAAQLTAWAEFLQCGG